MPCGSWFAGSHLQLCESEGSARSPTAVPLHCPVQNLDPPSCYWKDKLSSSGVRAAALPAPAFLSDQDAKSAESSGKSSVLTLDFHTAQSAWKPLQREHENW